MQNRPSSQTGPALGRRIVAAALAAGALFAPPARAADPFLAHEVRFLNAFAPGGTSDLIGRILAEQLGR